ncbi:MULTISPECIES: DNA polymerase beta superfamily protein [unclassified Streptomyces]|uniref:nucleotidyltransferase domain-containing protein n=1 Tax=unclassified Streptomyces TaxID=2593676 RepID=UPI0037FBE090
MTPEQPRRPKRHELPELSEHLVTDHTVYSCVMGSRAFGLATEDSDSDVRGVYLAPTPLFWRFAKPPTHVEGRWGLPCSNEVESLGNDEQFSWELERFCELALRSNPNVLECLHSPLVERIDDTGRELLALREAFLSRQAEQSFTRYALGRRKRLDADVRLHGAPRWKHAMHLLRLLMSCRDLLRTGVLTIDVGAERDRLLAVKRGEVSWPEVESWMARLAAESERAAARSPLAPEPDRARVADFLFRVRRESALKADEPSAARSSLNS